MDIISNKKSKLLYQRGDITNQGVIDLRYFSEEKKQFKPPIKPKKKIFTEIIPNNSTFKPLPQNNEIENSNKNFNSAVQISPETKEETVCEISNIFSTKTKYSNFKLFLLFQKSYLSFVLASLLVSLSVFSLSAIQNGIEKKGEILGISTQAYDDLKLASQSATNQNFDNSVGDFNSANLKFSHIKEQIESFGFGVTGIISNLPINTPVSTATNLAEAGENISSAGENITNLLNNISKIEPKDFSANLIYSYKDEIDIIVNNLINAESNINQINLDYVPDEYKSKITLSKNGISVIANNLQNLSEDYALLSQMIGKDRPQKYLLLFQNNSEIRATGGFIGSYGILDLKDGKMTNLFIDGIFNPDGQLQEKVVPPMPIQKISAAWSMHDANWFADFPTSAQKIALFYEKTGGPTVDGIISLTPNVIKKILAITGPIEIESYNTTVTKDNFLEKTQLQVEELFDKEENKPKKFLSDVAPIILNNLLDTNSMSTSEKIKRYLDLINIIEESMAEKHIVFYHRNQAIENMIIKRGWGGQILNSSGDYLSVVNSNINGYKTDAVIDEEIYHSANILSDGSIINTVKIIRKHNGGNSDYNWYNRVNSNYQRVYVPLGSTLLRADGHTVQTYEPPMNYANFQIDSDVKNIEDSIKIDPESKTQIFEESGKTVFGNWVYVSPGETVEVVYEYELPYKIDFDSFTKPADKYSILIQKQLGSNGSYYFGSISMPSKWNIVWESENLSTENQAKSYIEAELRTDKSYGIVFTREIENNY